MEPSAPDTEVRVRPQGRVFDVRIDHHHSSSLIAKASQVLELAPVV